MAGVSRTWRRAGLALDWGVSWRTTKDADASAKHGPGRNRTAEVQLEGLRALKDWGRVRNLQLLFNRLEWEHGIMC